MTTCHVCGHSANYHMMLRAPYVIKEVCCSLCPDGICRGPDLPPTNDAMEIAERLDPILTEAGFHLSYVSLNNGELSFTAYSIGQPRVSRNPDAPAGVTRD